MDALLEKAEFADNIWKANESANSALVTRLENLQNNIDQLKEDLADTDNYQNVSIDNFATKMNKIATKMEAAQKEVEEAYAAGTSQALRTETSTLADLRTDVNSIITDIYNSAAQREVKARVEALVDAAAAVTYDESKYTAGDVATIKAAINAINNYAHTEDNKGILDGDNLANKVDKWSFAGDLATIKTYSDNLDEAMRIIAEESLEPEPVEPSVLPGDVTGTGSVDDADFDKFVEDFLNDNLPSAGDANFAAYDANGDGQVDIADVQAIFNLSMGLNVDGTDPDAVAAPALDFEGFSAGNMSVQTTQLSNGNTQVAIQLNSTADYRAFAIDGVGDWTLYDGDQATTLVTPRIPVTYENQGAPMAFQVFNTTETQTWVEDNMDYAFKPYSGEQYMAAPSVDYPYENDDWLITPRLDGRAQTIKFWAKAATFDSEWINVYTSTTDNHHDSFVKLNDEERIYVGDGWREYSFDVPEGGTDSANFELE